MTPPAEVDLFEEPCSLLLGVWFDVIDDPNSASVADLELSILNQSYRLMAILSKDSR